MKDSLVLPMDTSPPDVLDILPFPFNFSIVCSVLRLRFLSVWPPTVGAGMMIVGHLDEGQSTSQTEMTNA